jgi:cytochrome bd-type quinol oxidase subunit 2
MRLGAVGSGENLLVVAAALVLATLMSGFTWAERVFLFQDEVAAFGTDMPGQWWLIALGVGAWVVVAAGPLRAVDDPSRRRITVALSIPLFLLIMTTPGRLVVYNALDPESLVDYLRLLPSYAFGSGVVELPAAALATWVALRALRRLSEPARQRAMAAALALLAGAAVLQTALRPDLRAEYAQSAWQDLGTATFLAALAVLVALAALVRMRPQRA